jgi:hypothetical protein
MVRTLKPFKSLILPVHPSPSCKTSSEALNALTALTAFGVFHKVGLPYLNYHKNGTKNLPPLSV